MPFLAIVIAYVIASSAYSITALQCHVTVLLSTQCCRHHSICSDAPVLLVGCRFADGSNVAFASCRILIVIFHRYGLEQLLVLAHSGITNQT